MTSNQREINKSEFGAFGCNSEHSDRFQAPKVIILAGGKGTRLPNSAKHIPKVLVDVQGKPLLLHQLEILRSQGFFDIRFSLGHLAEQVVEYLDKIRKKHGGKYDYVIEKEPLGTGGAIKKACEDLEGDFLVLNGDILADIDLQKFVEKHQSLKGQFREPIATIALWQVADAKDFGLVNLQDNQIKEFLEKPEQSQPGLINAGFYILSPKIFQAYQERTFSIEHKIFPLLAEKGRLFGFVHKGNWIDVGTEERLKIAREKKGL